MTDSDTPDWIALGPHGPGTLACAMKGGRLVRQGCFDGEAEAVVALGADGLPAVRVGAGTGDAVPASVLPRQGRQVPPMTQPEPRDEIDGWARLRLAGVVAARPDWDGVICLVSDTLAQWVHVSAGEAVSSQGALTGRLAAALGSGPEVDADAVADTLSRPERLAAHLRAATLAARPGAVSGHLIGAELAAARPYWLGQEVIVVTAGDAAAGRAAALEAQGVPVTRADTDQALASGLAALGRALGLTG